MSAVFTSFATDRSAGAGSGDDDLIVWTTSKGPKPPLIYCHQHAASLKSMLALDSYRALWSALAEDYEVGVADLGYPDANGYDRWGNSFGRGRVDQLRTLLVNERGATGKLALVCASMGGATALNWANSRGANETAFVAATVPLIDMNDLRYYQSGGTNTNPATGGSGTFGVYQPAIDNAYGAGSGPYSNATHGATNSPYVYRASYDSDNIPTAFWTVLNDPVCRNTWSGAFVSANPTIQHTVMAQALGHTQAAIDAANPGIIEFARKMRFQRYAA